MTDPITEADIHAFVDDKLDVARRMELEDHLSRYPDIAARVMADLRARDAFRLAFGGRPAHRPNLQVMDAARRLERGLMWRRIGLRLRRAAAVVLLVGAGWFAHAQIGLLEITDTEASPTPPAFVEDARHSHQTALIRARMASQPEAADYDSAEILAETGIVLPELPRDWRVVDAQVFPSRLGHSVEIALETEALGRVSVFAARSQSFGVIAPTLAGSPKGTTVYWQSGDLPTPAWLIAYQLVLARCTVLLARHTLNTPWDSLHRCYFNGYAMLTYLNTPFQIALPGFDVEQNAVAGRRRNLARAAGDISSRDRKPLPVQDFYFGPDFLLRRHDYQVDISGSFPTAQYVYHIRRGR